MLLAVLVQKMHVLQEAAIQVPGEHGAGQRGERHSRGKTLDVLQQGHVAVLVNLRNVAGTREPYRYLLGGAMLLSLSIASTRWCGGGG